jgi:hypothetical protein
MNKSDSKDNGQSWEWFWAGFRCRASLGRRKSPGKALINRHRCLLLLFRSRLIDGDGAAAGGGHVANYTVARELKTLLSCHLAEKTK